MFKKLSSLSFHVASKNIYNYTKKSLKMQLQICMRPDFLHKLPLNSALKAEFVLNLSFFFFPHSTSHSALHINTPLNEGASVLTKISCLVWPGKCVKQL